VVLLASRSTAVRGVGKFLSTRLRDGSCTPVRLRTPSFPSGCKRGNPALPLPCHPPRPGPGCPAIRYQNPCAPPTSESFFRAASCRYLDTPFHRSLSFATKHHQVQLGTIGGDSRVFGVTRPKAHSFRIRCLPLAFVISPSFLRRPLTPPRAVQSPTCLLPSQAAGRSPTRSTTSARTGGASGIPPASRIRGENAQWGRERGQRRPVCTLLLGARMQTRTRGLIPAPIGDDRSLLNQRTKC
jgi:hypothetical protein